MRGTKRSRLKSTDGREATLRRLNHPATRAKIATDMQDILNRKGQPDYQWAAVASFAPNTFV